MLKQDAEYKEGNTSIVSAYVNAPFDDAKAELENKGYELISLQDNAKLRIAKGAEHRVSQNGNYVREGFLYVPQKGIFLVRNSPIMVNAKEATECHRNGREFYLTNEQVEETLKDSIQVKLKNGETIPTNRFGENELTAYAFKENAQEYGEFLKEAGISEMPVWCANMQNKPFARQAWLRRLDGCSRSDLNDYYRYLYYFNAVRGVRLASTEGAKPVRKIENYTPV